MNPFPSPTGAAFGAAQPITRYDQVRVPDGRIGEVVGYFREADQKLLVLLDSERKRFLRADLRLLNKRIDPFRAVGPQAVHHNSDECKTGNFIELSNRSAGDGGLPLCMECVALGSAGPAVV